MLAQARPACSGKAVTVQFAAQDAGDLWLEPLLRDYMFREREREIYIYIYISAQKKNSICSIQQELQMLEVYVYIRLVRFLQLHSA